MIDIDALGLSEEEKVQVAMLAGHERAKRSFARFVPYVKISESGEGMVPLLEWDHIKTLNRVLTESKRVVLAKSRQIGITTDLSANLVYEGVTHQCQVPLVTRIQDPVRFPRHAERFDVSILFVTVSPGFDR